MSAGSVLNVEEKLAGSELAADAAAAATSITVEDPTDFQPDGGELVIGLEEKAYSAVNEATGVITLDTGLASSYVAGDAVYVLPTTTERFAHVQLEGQDETLQARVPHNVYPLLAVGLRDPNADELELVELDRDPSGELVVADVLGILPTVDTAYASTDTPPVVEPTSDGSPPGSSPPATVKGGVNFLVVQWPAIANADPVTYEVHLSTSSGFTPSVATHVATVRGTMSVVRNLPGLAPLAMGQTYYARLVATDADGAAAAGVEGSGQLNPAAGGDVIAGVVTAEMLEAVLVLATTMIAGTLGAGRVELGIATDEAMGGMVGIHAMSTDGMTVTFMVDAATGEVFVKGHMDFGANWVDPMMPASRLTADNLIELMRQESTTFKTPVLAQSAAGRTTSLAGNATMSVTWPAPTTTGATLLLAVLLYDPDGSAPTPANPTGWGAPIANEPEGTGRLVVWKIENAAQKSGAVTITLNDTCYAVAQLFEYHGVGVQDVAVVTAGGTSSAPAVGPSATTTQTDELWIAFLASIDPPPESPSSGDGTQTDAFVFIREDTPPTPGGKAAVIGAYHKNVVAIGTADVAWTLADSEVWMSALITFKAKVAGVETPDAEKIRLYGRDVAGNPYLHAMNDAGIEGALVLGKPGEVWREEYVSASVNIPNTSAGTGGNLQVTLASLVVGDICELIGASNVSRQFYKATRPVCVTAGQITLDYFNMDTAAVDPGADTMHFRITHRS